MHVRRFTTHVEVLAPAKINLFLAVLGKRADGYHEVETVLAAVSLFDTLTFAPQPDRQLQLSLRWCNGIVARDKVTGRKTTAAHELLAAALPSGPENLVWRAAALLQERSGTPLGAAMQLTKRIPAAAGLGGASSDAAAALLAANIAWGLHWPLERLQTLAAELGSDIPFFLGRGAAMCRGRGEIIEPIRGCPLHIVVVRPRRGLSTEDVYQRCRPSQRESSVGAVINAMKCGNAASVGRHLVNDLQAPASELTHWIATLEREFARQPTLGHQMSGSGSSYFGLCRSRRQARRMAARLRARNIDSVFVARSVNG